MDPSTTNKMITGGYRTTLLVAALAEQTSFVEKDVRIAKAMVYKNPDLPNIHDDLERTPVIKAIDITLDILIKKPELAKARINENGDTALHMLCRKSSAIIGFNGIYNTALMQRHLPSEAFSKLCKFIKLKDPQVYCTMQQELEILSS
ncbi:hypothetical protein Csa_014052 [Cucumis sativus]|nr:hypothetical protein Csa_014052 [Cucumis sativus]